MSLSRIFFFLLAIGLVSFSFYYGHQKERKETKQETESLVFKDELKVSNVNQVLIQKSDQGQLKIVREKNGWMLKEPLEDDADKDRVESLIQNILSQNVSKIEVDASVDWSDYGLDSPFAKLTLTNKEGEIFIIEASDQSTFDQQIFLKKENQLFLGTQGWDEIFQSWEDAYRSQKLLNVLKTPTRISFQTSQKNDRLKRNSENQWEWEGEESVNRKFPLSSAQVEKLIRFLKSNKVQDFSTQKKKTWEVSDLEIEMDFLDESWRLELKKFEEKNTQVIVSGRDFIFELSATDTEELLKMNFEDLHFPFESDLEKLSQFELLSSDVNFVLKKEKGEWKVVEPLDHEVDLQNLSRFLEWFETVEAKDFHQKEIQGKQVAQIFLKSDAGDVLLEMNVAREEEDFFVKTSLNSEESYSIDGKAFMQVFSSSLIKKQTE